MSADPKAWILCGIPGSGKTTLAKKLAKKHNAHVISGDDISDELFHSDPSGKSWGPIWDRLVELVEENCHRNIIVDGVHASRGYRAETLTLLESYGYRNIELIVIDCTLEKALRQNAQRDRNVEEWVIRAMHKELCHGLETVCTEGFTKITFLR
jgi:predicted kinase